MRRHIQKTVLVLLGIGVVVIPIRSQERGARPSFEVVSIKPNTSGAGGGGIGTRPGGLFTATNVPAKMLIRQAYRMQDFQIIGGPNWLTTDRFDVEARAEAGAVPPPSGPPDPTRPNPIALMLQSMLEDRFQLKVHIETRELPVYNLVVGRDGSKMKSSADQNPQRGAAPPVPPPPVGPPPPGGPGPRGAPVMGPGSIRIGGGNLVANTIAMPQFVNTLSQMVGRPVVDKTGLTGMFDIDLRWTPEGGQGGPFGPGGPAGPEIAPAPVAADPSAPSIFTAVQEQLGLRLESAKGPVEVIVIDSVQKPTEN